MMMTAVMALAIAANYHSSFFVQRVSVTDIPVDTLSHVRVKKTDFPTDEKPIETSLDLADPENLKVESGEYDEKSGYYKVGTKLGDNYLSAPYLMTPAEYLEWTNRKSLNQYFKERNDSLFARKGREKFDFTDMHFDLGPAEKIFGPGGVRIQTRGSAELKFGYNYKYTDNPSLSERNRRVTSFDFDEIINLNVNAKIGDKMDFTINYNTDATYDFDAKNLNLSYKGKEDEIVKLLEAGNISHFLLFFALFFYYILYFVHIIFYKHFSYYIRHNYNN